MLPLKPSDLLIVEKGGTKFGLRYLLGPMQSAYMKLMRDSAAQIRILGRLQTKLKTVSEDDTKTLDSMIAELDCANDALAVHRNALVEMFLATVNGDPVTTPISEAFRPGDIDALSELVQENLPELSGNEVREIKNSSRPHGSHSTVTDNSTGAIDATVEQSADVAV